MLKKSLIGLTTVGAAVGLCTPMKAKDPLAEGARLPVVTVKTHTGEEITLSHVAAEGYALVYFYPKADTPGCTKQACSLRDSFAELSDKGVKVYGVSIDSVASQKAFAEKYKLPFVLLADTEKEVLTAFAVPTIPAVGLAKRQAFLFKDGVLVWKDLTASTDKQAADILAYLKSLKS